MFSSYFNFFKNTFELWMNDFDSLNKSIIFEKYKNKNKVYIIYIHTHVYMTGFDLFMYIHYTAYLIASPTESTNSYES